MRCAPFILATVATAGLCSAAAGQTMSKGLLDDLTAMCARLDVDPTSAILKPDSADDFFAVNGDNTQFTNSFYWDGKDGAKHSMGFTRDVVLGGALNKCSIWHAYWTGAHPYPDMLDVIDAYMAQISNGAATRSGGQLQDIGLKAERYMWTDGTFPPAVSIKVFMNHDSVNLYLNKVVRDDG